MVSITDLKEIAQLRGGDCLGVADTTHSRTKFIWQCAEGHTWEARIDSVKRGTWCRICKLNQQKNTIEEMRDLAIHNGGECLSQDYKNSHTKLKWKCNDGHIFEATPSKIKLGRWCKICGNQRAALSRRIPLIEIHEIAKSRNGICLSEKYNPKTHLKWQCEFGHIWEANIHSVKSGSWCPICGRGKGGKEAFSIEDMQAIAKSRGGECLSLHYKNVNLKLKWKCEKGHVWAALPTSIKKGHWCPDCAGNKKLNIEQVKKIAHERGGICLSNHYRGNHEKIKWQCSEGHIWFATYSNISLGGWCPECSSGIGERICRAHFEQMFCEKFPKTRPLWLINQDGFQMELNGYCKDLKLAFEHQGKQHFQYIDYYYSSNKQFKKRQRDDNRKKELCEENNITLIEIPEIPTLLSLPEVKKYIIRECKKARYNYNLEVEQAKVELRTAYFPDARIKLKLIKEVACAHGGICLSPAYLGMKAKLRFRCANRHEWDTVPDVILKGHWCPKCSAAKRGFARKLTLDEMNQLAQKHGGQCLSQTYLNANSHLLWECRKGHQWSAIPNSVKRGSWCPVCSKERRGIKANSNSGF